MKKIYVFTVLFCLAAQQSIASSHLSVELMKSEPKVIEASLCDVFGAVVGIILFFASIGLAISIFSPKPEEKPNHGGHGHGGGHGHDTKHDDHSGPDEHDDHGHKSVTTKNDSHDEGHSKHETVIIVVEKPHSVFHVEKKQENQTIITKNTKKSISMNEKLKKFDLNVSGDFDKEWS